MILDHRVTGDVLVTRPLSFTVVSHNALQEYITVE